MSRAGIAISVSLTLGALGVLGWRVVSDAMPLPHADLDHSRRRPQGGMYSMALPEPVTLNPFLTSGGVALRVVLHHTHDTLMEYDPETGERRSALAESLAVSGLHLAFRIRAGARFSDGSPVTTEDLLFGFELRQHGVDLGGMGAVLENIAMLRATAPRTLDATLKTRTFASVDGFATGYIVAKRDFFLGEIARLAAADGESAPQIGSDRFEQLFAQVIQPGPGTGPYEFARWDRGQDLFLIQNPHSWRRAARPADWNLAGLRLRFVSDPAACFVLARSGGLDLYSDYDAPGLLRRTKGFAATHRTLRYDHLTNGHFLVIWNHRRKPLDKPEVREALTRLFDRDEILKVAFSGSGVTSRTWFHPGSELDVPAAAAIPFDPAGARQRLAKAGASDLSVEILYPGAHPVHTDIMNIAIPAFEAAGVELKATPLEFGTLVSRLQEADFDGLLLYLGSAIKIDPYFTFHASQIGIGQNWMGYDNPEVNALLKSAREELDDVKRLAMYQRFNQIFLREQPVTLIAHPLSCVILSRRFHGVKPGAMGLSFEKWWVEPNRPPVK